MAKLVELHEMSYKIAKSSLRPMATYVVLLQTCFKTATFSLRPMAKLTGCLSTVKSEAFKMCLWMWVSTQTRKQLRPLVMSSD
jgi:hypothetical protein